MAATIKACEREAEQHGCTLDVDTSGVAVEISLFSPQGKVFAGTRNHIECGIHGNGYQQGFKPDWSQTLADIKRILGEGFAECDDPECEMCHPEHGD